MQKRSAKNWYIKSRLNIGVEIDNYQLKVLLLDIFQHQLIQEEMKKSEFHSYISDDNEQDACDSHDHIFHLLKNDLIQGY